MVPDTVPPLKLPEKVVDVVTPVANIFPSGLNVIPLPTRMLDLAVIIPTASTFVTSS